MKVKSCDNDEVILNPRRFSVLLSKDTHNRIIKFVDSGIANSKAAVIRSALDIFIAYKLAEFCKQKGKRDMCMLWGAQRLWLCDPMECPINLKECEIPCLKKAF